MSQARPTLGGKTVLVTRPAERTEQLAERIESLGGTALRMPAIAIEALDPPALPDAEPPADIVIFVSRHAVRYGAQVLRRFPDAAVGAIGPSTAAALHEAGAKVGIVPPDGYTSEALLATPPLQSVDGRRIVIVRGQGGRELLGCKLLQRGASVDYAEVYHRVRPVADIAPIVRHWKASGIDLVTATSVETLQNLIALLGDSATPILRDARLVTASERVVQRARSMALQHEPLLADGPDNQSLLEAMLGWSAGTA